MKSKKIMIIVLVIILTVTSSITNTAYGLSKEEQTFINKNNHVVTPFWNNINEITSDISAEGTTIYAEVYIKANSSSGTIKGTMYLERYVSNKWTNETSWSISGTGSTSLSKSYKGIKGSTYRIKIVVTVDGETATAYSGTCEL